MRTTFSRTFFPAALLLLAALLVVGIFFQMLVRDFLNNQTLERLENDGKAISTIASAYYTEDSLSGKDFLVNLSLATQVSDANAVIFDIHGVLLLCSDSPFSCEHQGWVLSGAYMERVITQGIARDTERTAYLESIGIHVLRFSNADVMNNLRGVCERIDLSVKERVG